LVPLACGPGKKAVDTPPLKDPAGGKKTPKPAALPEIPAQVDAKRVQPLAGNVPSAKSPIIDYMAAENARWMKVLKNKPDAPAFYLAYQMWDRDVTVLNAEGGAIIGDRKQHDRLLDVDVLVGTPQVYNRRQLAAKNASMNEALARHGRAPFGSDRLAIQQGLWLETDRRYREAALQLAYVKQDKSVTVDKDKVDDFVHAQAEEYYQPLAKHQFDEAKWEKRVKECSKKALRGKATRGSCRVEFRTTTVYFVNSEGTKLQLSWTSARLMVSVGVKARDGMPLSRLEQRFARSAAELPSDEEIDKKMIAVVNKDLDALHEAPVVDPYNGPAILEGRAAGVFFHEVFGHRIEGHRQKGDVSGRTFSAKVGKQIMPAWMTVYDDPTINSINGRTLNGFYRFDDEGVRAQKAVLVDKGVLRGFVMGRNPISGFPHSNGHGRKMPGLQVVSRQGNLVVAASRSVTDEELHKRLIAEVKRQGKPFGMVFTDISGGFTNTSQFAPQAFKVNPVMAYRVYPSGKRELVRGVDIVGTPLTALGSIMAAGRTVQTFNGMCGAESGWVPVSATAPSLLLKNLEVENGFKGRDRPPVLSPPSIRAQGGQR
jgi:predicted Zn-dependent protease